MTITWEEFKEKLSEIAEKLGEWAGIPLILEDLPLSIAKNYSLHNSLDGQKYGSECDNDDKGAVDIVIKEINSWFNLRYNCEIVVYEMAGKRYHFKDTATNAKKFRYSLQTLSAVQAWSVSAEEKALNTLKSLVTDHAYKCYFLTGMFLETSKASGVTYIFRKGKPTIALRPDKQGEMKVLCCLCLHPVGYYHGSFAGCMTPTDDVIAHLTLMRGTSTFFGVKQTNIHLIPKQRDYEYETLSVEDLLKR